ncbi:tRNA 2'-phosphotransferase [Choristoneura fumiferana]|uniref:tRNA 2'-phosphotransferase n=1 Tax=Choristoneura fumiferana TaxID=7141 RepID=UPI003D1558D2
MNSKDIRLSKSLSWLLRHGAVQEGFNISPEGYLDVDTVLRHKTFQGYSRCDIERVVRNNEKQRFQLRQDPSTRSLQIKANQGHSIDAVSDAELTPILTAKYTSVVHGTSSHCWPLIQQAGLSRMRRNHIHFAKSTSSTDGIRSNANLHIYIDLERALRDGIKFYEADNGVILTSGNADGFLEPKYFSRVLHVATGAILYP